MANLTIRWQSSLESLKKAGYTAFLMHMSINYESKLTNTLLDRKCYRNVGICYINVGIC